MKKIVVAVLGLAAAFVFVNSGSAEAGHYRTGYGYGANYGAYVGVGVVAPRYPATYGAYYGGSCNQPCAPAPCVTPAPPCVTPAYYGPRPGCAAVVAPACRPCGLGW